MANVEVTRPAPIGAVCKLCGRKWSQGHTCQKWRIVLRRDLPKNLCVLEAQLHSTKESMIIAWLGRFTQIAC